MFRSIVVGTDGSETANEAVRQAAELAGQLGARVHLVCVYEPVPSAQDGPGDEVDVAVAVGRRKQQAVSLRAGSGGALLRHPDQIGQPHRNQPGTHRANVPVVMIQPRRQFAHLLHAVHPQQRDDDVERQD